MKEEKRHIKGESEEASKWDSEYGFDGEVMSGREDTALFGEISSYMRAKIDIDDVQNDPCLDSARNLVKEMVSDYNGTVSRDSSRSDNKKFIRDSVSDEKSEEAGRKALNEIKIESAKSDINLITSEWVKDWHKKKQMAGSNDFNNNEIKEFITSSLADEQADNKEESKAATRKSISRSLFIRYISISAAAVIGALFIINSLLPSPSPMELYNSYYKPFDAISPVTRGAESRVQNLFVSAINNYKSGDYVNAADGFAKVMLLDPTSIIPLFYMGLTAIELGSDFQAIADLSLIASSSGEYSMEAKWYLGLVYLKTDNKELAVNCFSDLANSSEFYRPQAEKILRRLK